MNKLMNEIDVAQCHLGYSDLIGIKGGTTATVTVTPPYQDYSAGAGGATITGGTISTELDLDGGSGGGGSGGGSGGSGGWGGGNGGTGGGLGGWGGGGGWHRPELPIVP